MEKCKRSFISSYLPQGLLLESSQRTPSNIKVYSVDELAGLLEKDGFTVTRGKTPSGKPLLAVVMGKSGFQVDLNNCEGDKKCQDIHFRLAFQNVKGASVEMMNNWNMKTRMTKAYMQGRDPAIEMDIPIEGGVSETYLKNYISSWRSIVGTFVGYLNGAPL